MENQNCPKCGAHWIEGQLYWSTGAMGKEEDLAGLVCNELGDSSCINPKNGVVGGQTWEWRLKQIDMLLDQALDGAGDDQL